MDYNPFIFYALNPKIQQYLPDGRKHPKKQPQTKERLNTTIPRIMYWDIETAGISGFKADLAKIVCFGYKFSDEKKPHVITINQFRGWFSPGIGLNDKPLLVKALEIFEEADLLVAHFGDKFDRRFFHGRLAIHGLKPPPPTKQRDTWRIARGAFALSSNRLGHLCQVFGVPQQKHQKTRDEWPGWWDGALAGGDKLIQKMAEYCKKDVLALEALYEHIRPFDNLNHPHLYPDREKPVCGQCGSKKVQYRGHAFAGQHKYPRFSCMSCGRWDRDRKCECHA